MKPLVNKWVIEWMEDANIENLVKKSWDLALLPCLESDGVLVPDNDDAGSEDEELQSAAQALGPSIEVQFLVINLTARIPRMVMPRKPLPSVCWLKTKMVQTLKMVLSSNVRLKRLMPDLQCSWQPGCGPSPTRRGNKEVKSGAWVSARKH